MYVICHSERIKYPIESKTIYRDQHRSFSRDWQRQSRSNRLLEEKKTEYDRSSLSVSISIAIIPCDNVCSLKQVF